MMSQLTLEQIAKIEDRARKAMDGFRVSPEILACNVVTLVQEVRTSRIAIEALQKQLEARGVSVLHTGPDLPPMPPFMADLIRGTTR